MRSSIVPTKTVGTLQFFLRGGHDCGLEGLEFLMVALLRSGKIPFDVTSGRGDLCSRLIASKS